MKLVVAANCYGGWRLCYYLGFQVVENRTMFTRYLVLPLEPGWAPAWVGSHQIKSSDIESEVIES